MVPKSLPELRGTLGSLLRTLSDALTREVYGRLAEEGFGDLRVAHGALFRNIPPEGARTVDLAARAGMTKQSMGYLVEELAGRGYVETVPDPSDRRAQTVRLTKRGVAAQETLTRLSGEVEAAWAQRVGAREWAITRRTVEALAAMLEEGSGRKRV